jgi:hypothetical protein
LSDPDAWMSDISDIISQKNQTKQDAATLKREREQHHINEVQKVRELVSGAPTEAFQQFGSYLNAQGETAKIKLDSDDKEGPWVGVDISDADGKFLDIKFQGRVGVAEPQWFWVYAYGDRNNRNAQEEEALIGGAGPSSQYVIETLAEHYKKASAKHR